MTTNFHTEIEQGNVGLRFWCYVQGIPYAFVDGAIPVGGDGVTFDSPIDGGGGDVHHSSYPANSDFVIKESMLDVSKGLQSIGADISRRTGVTSPGQMTITLRDNDDFLTELFATNLATAATTELTEDFTRQSDPSPSSAVNVEDHSAFASSGLLYIGRETVHYSGKAGAAGVDARFTGLTRNVCALGNHDVYYNQHDYKASAPRTVSNNPRSWTGRYIRVFAFLTDEFGRALNRGNPSGWSNTDGYQLEIFRGIIAHNPRPSKDWTTFKIKAKSLEVLLDQEIGGNFPEATLVNAPGSKTWNEAGQVDPNGDFGGMYSDNNTAILVGNGTNRIHMRIEKWLNWTKVAQETPTQVNDYTGENAPTLDESSMDFLLSSLDSDLEGGICSIGNLWHTVAHTINLRFAAAGWNQYIKAYVKSGGADGPYEIRVTTLAGAPASAYFRVEFHWGAKNSVGHLLGYTELGVASVDNSSDVINDQEVLSMIPDHANKTVGYVTEDQTQIIYWLKTQADGGEQVQPVTANGYALIGDKEIIKYAADVDVTTLKEGTEAAYFHGMRVLKGCTRGVFDTKRTRHIMTVDDLNKVTSEAVDIKFGFGADEDSWADAFLKLALSTGIEDNNSTLDVYAKEAGAAISANHFDDVAFKTYSESGGDTLDKMIRFFSSEPINLKSWIEDFLQPRMCYIAAINSGYFNYEHLLSLIQIRPALTSEYVVTLTANDIDFQDPATFQAGNTRICNRIRCHYRWSFAEEKATDDLVIATDWDSVQDHGGIKSMTWKLKGQQWSYDQAYVRISMWALRAFQRYAQDYDILNLKVNRKGLSVSPGDTVKLTLAGAPTNTGVRGFSDVVAVCIRADHTWHEPGGSPTSMLTVVVEPAIRRSVYCPSATTHSATTIDGSPAILILDNDYTASGSTTYLDATHFEAGDKIAIHNPGDYSTRDLRTIVSKTTSTVGADTFQALIINSALSNATAGGSNPAVVTYQQYDQSTSTQKEHVFISSDTNVLSVATTESFKYV